MEFIKSMFSGPQGDISAKRVCALLLITAGIVYAFIGLFTGKPDNTIAGLLFGSGTGLLSIQAITKT